MLSFVFDTETTGAAAKKDPFDQGNDKIMQFYGGLYEHDLDKNYLVERKVEDGSTQLFLDLQPIVSFNFLVLTDKDPHKQAVAVHGITKERANQIGIAPDNLAHLISDVMDVADRFVCHNITFDTRMVKHLFASENLDPAQVDEKEHFCTMEYLKPIMRMTPKVYGDWKNPKLIEAHQYIFGRGFEGAHDATADSNACAAIYFAILAMDGQKN
ncbi:DNA polymerase III epsilon subunit-like protein [Rhizobium rosettiformans]|uniref:3'-5' exonuclease n=2 Tax=Rhizobium rosettiformans TaxID=1368430 RepID=A0A4V6T6L0_9HYPH|nr:3'-5' exonuclease [Rhizobium rosettiformans]MBB5276274.1 DNA polymerase III epsilon subunit-like protein [Rhizobium rosettiformans]THV36906.1 3'-5' exonuclease [Rhizobium rosettiformans W3]